MIHFDFTKLGGMPFYQEQFNDLQNAFEKPIKAIASLAGGGNWILSGVKEITPGIGVYSDGYIIYDGQIMPFVGGAYQSTVKVVEIKESLTFADGLSKEVVSKKHATFGTGAVQFNFSALKPFQIGLGNTAREEWQTVDLGSLDGWMKYRYCPLSGIVEVRSRIKHFNLTTDSNPMMIGIGAIPSSLAPSNILYTHSGIATHSVDPILDINGGLYTGEVCHLGTDGTLAISQRRLDVASSPNFYHNISLQYFID